MFTMDVYHYLISFQFLSSVCRKETWDCPQEYSKAVRATLLSLGFDSDFIEDDFRFALDSYISSVLGGVE